MPSRDDKYETAIHAREYGVARTLAMEEASLNGYKTPAYHGTYNDFDEFRDGDIGFHFSRDLRCAQNRLDDIYDTDPNHDPRLLYVALSIHNPIVLHCDLGSWTARDIYTMANMKVTGIPFESTEALYLSEQKKVSRGAYRLLDILGIGSKTILERHKALEDDPNLNSPCTKELHDLLMNSKYDGIIYENDFEAFDGDDPICYIVFSPNQIKTLDLVWEGTGKLKKLSTRFDPNSPKFR